MKKINLTFLLLLIFLLSGVRASEKEYDVKRINKNILFDATSAVRVKSTKFEIKNRNSATEKVKRAITIFHQKDRDYGKIVLWYDKFHKVKDLEGKLFDAEGNEIKKLKSSDIEDYSAVDGYTLFDDSRVKIASLYHNVFPYTVEFTYEISYDGYINWPTWRCQESLNPIEQSRFEVVCDKDFELRYWVNADSVKPEIFINGGKKIYLWEEKEIPKLSEDVYGDDIEDVTSIVKIAPENFEISGYEGSMKSWKDFGLWFYNLSKNKNQLPQPAINEIKNLVDPDDEIHTKIEKLYKYMQSKTRYVSIQLGIGGWQPFDAKFVYEKGYGDCKALSNYMVSILNEAGIKSYPVLINNGSKRFPLISEFPSNQFNHVIVCVPLEKDTVWLECTSQTIPPNHIGYTNENRKALMITSEGGVLISTPKKNSGENFQTRISEVNLDVKGNAEVNSKTVWNGNQTDRIRGNVENATVQERELWIVKNLGVADARLQNFNFDGLNSSKPEINLELKVTIPLYASISGNRIFFKPNIMEKRNTAPKNITERKSPVRFVFPYLDKDSVYCKIPEGYKIEAIPGEINLESSFGKFSVKTNLINENTILYTRELKIDEYSIPAEKYSEYRSFFSEVVKSDKSQIVFVKK